MGDFVSSQAITPRWLKLRDACKYAAIGKLRLKSLAQAGEVAGHPDPDSARGDWIFDRLSLDRYRESQMGAVHVAALEIEKRFNL